MGWSRWPGWPEARGSGKLFTPRFWTVSTILTEYGRGIDSTNAGCARWIRCKWRSGCYRPKRTVRRYTDRPCTNAVGAGASQRRDSGHPHRYRPAHRSAATPALDLSLGLTIGYGWNDRISYGLMPLVCSIPPQKPRMTYCVWTDLRIAAYTRQTQSGLEKPSVSSPIDSVVAVCPVESLIMFAFSPEFLGASKGLFTYVCAGWYFCSI
jgi:hypothetical protein